MTEITGLVVFLESICGVFLISRKRKQGEESGEKTPDLLCRFVVDGSEKKIGESIAVQDDLLIIKMQKTYLGVPLKHVEEKGDVLQVKGLVSFEKAEILGRAWQEKYFKPEE